MNLAMRLSQRAYLVQNSIHKHQIFCNFSKLPLCYWNKSRALSTQASYLVPNLQATTIGYAQHRHHVHEVARSLQENGIIKISLGFEDNDSEYLQQLIHSLNRLEGHKLPISHSASRGWFWDVRPNPETFQKAMHQARSETMEEFPWHTDCSYENPPPRYFALHVLQPDRRGGGTLSVLNVARLVERLSTDTQASLARPEYHMTIPPEFIKDSKQRHIHGSVLSANKDGRATMMRFRSDILTPLTDRADRALQELKETLQKVETLQTSTLHLTAKDLPERSIILVDNRQWLHARNEIKDPQRHLRRVRWDAVPFLSHSPHSAGT